MEDTLHVAIIQQKRLLREGLAFALSRQPDIAVTASVAEAKEIIDPLPEPQPHIMIIDFDLPQRNGLIEVRKLRRTFPEAKILMIGMTELESDVIACIEAGAAGYLPHNASLTDLLNNIRAAVAGEALCTPKIAGFLFSHIAKGARHKDRLPLPGLIRLTRREHEIIELLEEGLSNKEISLSLRIELQTVKNHVHSILDKLQLPNRREVAQYARVHGLIRSVP